MPTLADDLDTIAAADPAPDSIEDLIPEVRRHTRRRRRRNLAIVLLAAVLAAGLITVTGSSSPANHQTGAPSSSPPPVSTRAGRATVVPKQPADLAVGPTGVLYLADDGRQQILRRTSDGRFRVVAGTGVAGYSGDGRLATEAEIDYPQSLAITAHGLLYFAQAGGTRNGGLLNSLVREISANGRITTVIGRHPNCRAVPDTSSSIPAQFARFAGAQLTISNGGALDISTTVCPNTLHLGDYLRLTSSGELVRTAAGRIPIPTDTSEFCGLGVPGSGFVAFGCDSGAGRGARLMVVRSNGTVRNYPDDMSEANPMATSDGTVVAIHNGAIVRVGADRLHTIATQRQLMRLVPGATGGWPGVGIAIDHRGNVYVDQDYLIRHHGCADAIFEIGSNGQRRSLWRSATTNSCY